MSLPIDTEVLSALRRLIRATDLDSKRLARQTNLSTSQLLVLELLAEGDAQTVGGIADRVGLAQATATSLVDRLEERGLVARRRSDSDRRQVNVTLTPAGRSLKDEAPTALQTRFLANFSKLQEWEKLAILSALKRVADLMEAEHLDASPVLDVGAIDRSPRPGVEGT
ncbi:MAG TPA: MarR family transcriptional regulator [Gammaproteobacteria bacterium]|nr:MarR family transcriptional regulator [Gammaproteobacteria bacterium]